MSGFDPGTREGEQMPLISDIQEATAAGRTISTLYARLRMTDSSADRADLLRQAGECADALGRRLRDLAGKQAQAEPDAETRAALGELSEAMEQVMVQEREYRMACGAPPDALDTRTGTRTP
jgi:hypothetical protein